MRNKLLMLNMMLIVVLAISSIVSGQVKQLHVGATFDSDDSRQSRQLDENGEPRIITEPQPGDEYVFISASKNLGGFRQGRQNSQSLFKEPEFVETGFIGRQGGFRTGRESPAAVQDDASAGEQSAPTDDVASAQDTKKAEPAPILKAGVNFEIFSLDDVVSAAQGEPKVVESENAYGDKKGRSLLDEQNNLKPVSGFKDQQEDTVPAASAVSSRTVIKKGPNGKDYEYEYLYYYDDEGEESDEEFEDVEQKKKATTTTTTTTTAAPKTTRGKRLRTKPTFAPIDVDAPKISNARGRIRTEESLVVNKPPITNLKDNSIARAINQATVENKAEETFKTRAEPTQREESTTAVQEKLKDAEETEAIVKISQTEEEVSSNESKPEATEDANAENQETSKHNEEKPDHDDDATVTEEKAELTKASDDEPEVVPANVEPMIIHAQMMTEHDFHEQQEVHPHGDDEETTHAPFDLEHDIAKPTSSTPDERSESIETTTPAASRLPDTTRFPPRIQAAIEIAAAAGSENEEEFAKAEDEETEVELEKTEDLKLDAVSEIQEFEKEAEIVGDVLSENVKPLSSEKLVNTGAPVNEEADARTETSVISEVPVVPEKIKHEEIAAKDHDDNGEDHEKIAENQEKQETPADHPEEHLAEIKEESDVTEVRHKQTRVNDARAIQNLFALSQAVQDEKQEIAREESTKEVNTHVLETVVSSEEKEVENVVQKEVTTATTTATTEVTTPVKASVSSQQRTRRPGLFRPRVPASQVEDDEKPVPKQKTTTTTTTTQVPTQRTTPSRRFSNRRTTTKASIPEPVENEIVAEDEATESAAEVTTSTQKPGRQRFRQEEGVRSRNQRTRKPLIPSDNEVVTPPITFEIKRQRPQLPSRQSPVARANPLDRSRQRTSTTTTTTESQQELDATEAPVEEFQTNPEVPQEPSTSTATSTTTTTTTTTAVPETEASSPPQEATSRPLRKRPTINVTEKAKRPEDVNPVVTRRTPPLGRRKTTPAALGGEDEVVATKSTTTTTTEKPEEISDDSTDATEKPTRLSLLEQNRARRLRTKPSA